MKREKIVVKKRWLEKRGRLSANQYVMSPCSGGGSSSDNNNGTACFNESTLIL